MKLFPHTVFLWDWDKRGRTRKWAMPEQSYFDLLQSLRAASLLHLFLKGCSLENLQISLIIGSIRRHFHVFWSWRSYFCPLELKTCQEVFNYGDFQKKSFKQNRIFFRPENSLSKFQFGENRWFMNWGPKLKKWKFKSKTARRVVQTCPLVLKLCEVAVLTSFITSESFVQKYSFFKKLSRIFDFPLKWFSLCVYWKQKHCLRATSKILDNFTKNEYFWAKLSEVVKLMSTATSQSLSTNGQVWSTLRAVLVLNFHFFSFEARSQNHRFSPNWNFENKISGRKKIWFFSKHFFRVLCW